MKQTAYLTIRLEIEDKCEVNPVNLCDELESYFAFNKITATKITGYNFEYDKLIPYEYNNCIETFIPNFHD